MSKFSNVVPPRASILQSECEDVESMLLSSILGIQPTVEQMEETIEHNTDEECKFFYSNDDEAGDDDDIGDDEDEDEERG